MTNKRQLAKQEALEIILSLSGFVVGAEVHIHTEPPKENRVDKGPRWVENFDHDPIGWWGEIGQIDAKHSPYPVLVKFSSTQATWCALNQIELDNDDSIPF